MEAFAITLLVVYSVSALALCYYAENPQKYPEPGFNSFISVTFNTILAISVIRILVPENPHWFGWLLAADFLLLGTLLHALRFSFGWPDIKTPVLFRLNALLNFALAIGIGYFYLAA